MTIDEVACLCPEGFPQLVTSVETVQAERTVRVRLRDGSFLDIFVGKTGPYSYHWQTSAGLYRFNNAPHFDHVETYPHKCTRRGAVLASSARRVAQDDVRAVLRFVGEHMG